MTRKPGNIVQGNEGSIENEHNRHCVLGARTFLQYLQSAHDFAAPGSYPAIGETHRLWYTVHQTGI